MQENLKRMIDLVGEVFDVKNDPSQINVTPQVLQKLQLLHPASLSESSTDLGPIAWVLVIPTTLQVMNKFLNQEITEQQLLDLTNADDVFEAIYLCSATVLPEYRHQGLAKTLTLQAIQKIKENYNIQALYYWKFTNEGEWLANALHKDTGIPLYTRA